MLQSPPLQNNNSKKIRLKCTERERERTMTEKRKTKKKLKNRGVVVVGEREGLKETIMDLGKVGLPRKQRVLVEWDYQTLGRKNHSYYI